MHASRASGRLHWVYGCLSHACYQGYGRWTGTGGSKVRSGLSDALHVTPLDARQLQTLSGRKLLPDKRHNVFSLLPLGRVEPQRGIRLKPSWREPRKLAGVVAEVLTSGSSDAFILLARNYEGPLYLHGAPIVEAWNAMPKLHRDQLARWCRRK